MPPNNAAPRQNIANEADENVRLRYRRRSSSGFLIRSACHANTPIRTMPAMIGYTTLGEVNVPVAPISASP